MTKPTSTSPRSSRCRPQFRARCRRSAPRSSLASSAETSHCSPTRSEKLDAWADDLKLGLEREIKELDRRIKETRTKSKGAATLAEKLEAQKEQRNLEAQRDKRRRDLFARQDEIEARRSRLIDDLERLLGQSVEEQVLVCCEWELA
jgi:hypothetical protein